MRHMFTDKVILAPMVRHNSLPFRLLCLRYGADLVYSEELVDHSLVTCTRLENEVVGSTDFVDDRGKVIFRTCPEEKGRIVLQLGSNCPERALRAAKLVCKDVAAIDFNFGCPKAFSLSGGMGAALLERPDQIEVLLKTAVKNLDIPVTCKIRILPTLDQTLKLVKLIASCGVTAIAVHGRTKDQRPHHENQNSVLRAIAETVSIPVIANGGSNHIKDYSDIAKFKEETKASSVMIARAAMRNPSIFNATKDLEPIEAVLLDFLKLSVLYYNYVNRTKYTVQPMMASGHYGGEFVRKFHLARDFTSLCDLFGLKPSLSE